jgi:argonaute-like protein implicated in RNA metabolism and viral defense
MKPQSGLFWGCEHERFFLTGEQLNLPPLRFNPSSLQARHQDARKGLKIYGPYDAQRLNKESVRCTLIYPDHLQDEEQTLISGLTGGYGPFSGFRSLFRLQLDFVSQRKIINERVSDIEQAIDDALQNDKPDLVIVILTTRDEKIYAQIKSSLLGNGIPSQVVIAEKLKNLQGVPWVLENIALQIYAKIGGTPWTIMSSSQQKELVIGISRAMDKKRNLVVGFITLFTHDGDYQYLYSLAPKPLTWDNSNEYRDSLANLIHDAYMSYERKVGRPSSVIVHLCKRPGKFNEVNAVKQFIKRIGYDIPYALLHLNDYTNYRLFDTTHPTYVPQSGIKVNINDYTSLLFSDGRAPNQTGLEIRRKKGVPSVLEVNMDKRSTVPLTEFPRLVYQVFAFSRLNWRGFNAQTVPVTLNYSYLVARLVSEIGAENWNHIASKGNLRDKAWFL